MWKQPEFWGWSILSHAFLYHLTFLLAKKHIQFLSLNGIICIGFAKVSASQEDCYFLAVFTKSLLGETELAGCLFTLMTRKFGGANNCNKVPCRKIFISASICLRARNPEGQVAVCRAYNKAIFLTGCGYWRLDSIDITDFPDISNLWRNKIHLI